MPRSKPSAAYAVYFALALVLLAGCGTGKPIHFYSLDVPSPAPRTTEPYPVSLGIGHFSAPSMYRDTRLVYRTGPTQMGLYEFQRWASPPAEMVESSLIRTLRTSGRFRDVEMLGSRSRVRYILRGRVSHFEEVSEATTGGRVALDVDLFDTSAGNSLWSYSYDRNEPAGGKDVTAVVEAINRNAQKAIDEVVGGLDQYFAQHPPAPAARPAKTEP